MQNNCPLCDRKMIKGPSVDRHHLIPKSRKGKETVLIHLICHRKIHSVFTEKELATKYSTIEKLKNNEEIANFILWVKNKHPEFIDTFRETKNKKQRR